VFSCCNGFCFKSIRSRKFKAVTTCGSWVYKAFTVFVLDDHLVLTWYFKDILICFIRTSQHIVDPEKNVNNLWTVSKDVVISDVTLAALTPVS